MAQKSASDRGKASKAAKTAKSGKAAKVAGTPSSPKEAAVKVPPATKSPAKKGGGLKSVLPHSSSAADTSRSSAAPRGAVSTKPHGRVRTFFREVRVEMKKVTWPPRKELITSTGVVIIAVTVAAVFIGVFDFIWNLIVRSVGLG